MKAARETRRNFSQDAIGLAALRRGKAAQVNQEAAMVFMFETDHAGKCN